jgi:hypothetical protein
VLSFLLLIACDWTKMVGGGMRPRTRWGRGRGRGGGPVVGRRRCIRTRTCTSRWTMQRGSGQLMQHNRMTMTLS